MRDRGATDAAAELYVELLKRCLTRSIFGGDVRVIAPARRSFVGRAYTPVRWALDRAGLRLVRGVSERDRSEGTYWPASAETMQGRVRLDHLHETVVRVLEDEVPGDLIETGVWRGGGSILMRGVLKAYGDSQRTVWVADSFEGLPAPDGQRFPADRGDEWWTFTELAVPLEEVQSNFARYGLLDEQVRFLPGWFADTLPPAPIDRLAILRLDGDMYGSTMDALDALYPRLSPGGFVIVDDYELPACREAVTDYRGRHRIEDELVPIDEAAVFWRRDVGAGQQQ